MDRNKAELIIHDRVIHGLSFRNLALKYGTPATNIRRLMKKHQPVNQPTIPVKPVKDELPDDVVALKALLRKERLKNELLNNIIDIADKELGTNIRKKSGTERSE